VKTRIEFDGKAYKVIVNESVVSVYKTYGEAERELFRLVRADMESAVLP
jgi:hypothetical protein